MIIVKIDMVPLGEVEATHEIGRIEIVNRGDHPARPEYGNYSIDLMLNGNRVEMEALNHKRSDGILPLLERICKAMREKGLT